MKKVKQFWIFKLTWHWYQITVEVYKQDTSTTSVAVVQLRGTLHNIIVYQWFNKYIWSVRKATFSQSLDQIASTLDFVKAGATHFPGSIFPKYSLKTRKPLFFLNLLLWNFKNCLNSIPKTTGNNSSLWLQSILSPVLSWRNDQLNEE